MLYRHRLAALTALVLAASACKLQPYDLRDGTKGSSNPGPTKPAPTAVIKAADGSTVLANGKCVDNSEPRLIGPNGEIPADIANVREPALTSADVFACLDGGLKHPQEAGLWIPGEKRADLVSLRREAGTRFEVTYSSIDAKGKPAKGCERLRSRAIGSLECTVSSEDRRVVSCAGFTVAENGEVKKNGAQLVTRKTTERAIDPATGQTTTVETLYLRLRGPDPKNGAAETVEIVFPLARCAQPS